MDADLSVPYLIFVVLCPIVYEGNQMIKATPRFMKLASKWMTSEALQELIDELTLHPETGVILKGGGGIRKIRWKTGKDNKGKSGGIRVLYYYEHKSGEIVLLITLFRKSDQENIDENEKAELKILLPELLRSSIYV